MENFELKSNAENTDELNMSVSPVCEKDGHKKAYVSFSDKTRSAEGVIPDCAIIKNDGFSEEEVSMLEDYMRANLSMMKRMASSVNVMDAFLRS